MRKKQRKRRQAARRVWSDSLIETLLTLCAPAIEAAGSFDKALQTGAIAGGDSADIAILRSLVPVSRGGTLRHPDADGDWEQLVAGCRERRRADLVDVRLIASKREQSGS